MRNTRYYRCNCQSPEAAPATVRSRIGEGCSACNTVRGPRAAARLARTAPPAHAMHPLIVPCIISVNGAISLLLALTGIFCQLIKKHFIAKECRDSILGIQWRVAFWPVTFSSARASCAQEDQSCGVTLTRPWAGLHFKYPGRKTGMIRVRRVLTSRRRDLHLR